MDIKKLLLVAVVACGVVSAPLAAQSKVSSPADFGAEVGAMVKELGGGWSPALASKNHGCAAHFISCGQTINTNLNFAACQTDNGFYVDLYFFSGQAGQTITANMSSSAFDTYLLLLDPTPDVVAFDDDGGPGSNSRIVFTLDQTSSEWVLAPSTFLPFVTGSYTLSLQCTSAAPPPSSDGYFTDSQYPDFRFRVRIGDPGDTILGAREGGCQPETVCVSGRVPGRSELFMRIIGPRPNGFLWPTIVRFTPSRVVVDIEQLSTGQSNQYILPAVPPGTDELPGLQDRMGFLP